MDMQDSMRRNVEQNERLLNNKENELVVLKYEVEVLTEGFVQRLKQYKDPLQYIDLYLLMFDFNRETGKFSKNTKQDKMALSTIEQYFFDEDTNRELVDIHVTGLDVHACEFHYKANGKTFSIKIPIFNTATLDNYQDLYYRITDEDPNRSYLIGVAESRFLEDMKDCVKKYLES